MKQLIVLVVFLLVVCYRVSAQLWVPLPNQEADFGSEGCVKAMTVYDGQLVVGGSFTLDTNADFDRIAQYDGNGWTDVGGGIHNDTVILYSRDVALLDTFNGYLLAGGNFKKFELGGFIKYDGEVWDYFLFAEGHTTASYRYDNKLYFGGGYYYCDLSGVYPLAYMDSIGGHSIPSYIASDGSRPIDEGIHAIVHYDGSMYFGGKFDYIDRNPFDFPSSAIERRNITRWDGENFLDVGGGLDGDVYCMAVYRGELYVSGNFYTAGGNSMPGFAKWNGSVWSRVIEEGIFPVDISPRALIVYDDKLFVGGSFMSLEDGLASVMSFDGAVWQPLVNSIDGEVDAFYVYDGELLMGGCFGEVDGLACNRVARYTVAAGGGGGVINNENGVGLYPNPVGGGDVVYVDDPKGEVVCVGLYDMVGRQVGKWVKEMGGGLAVGHLPKGLYVARIGTRKGTSVVRVVKQ